MDLRLKDERGLASLPVVDDWRYWWARWGPVIAARHGRAGWILFLLDANEKIQEVLVTLSRVLRNKPKWGGSGWAEREWLNVSEVAAETLAWYEKHAEGPMRDAPEWAKFLFAAQHGNLAVAARIGRELRAVQEQGYLVATIEKDSDGSMHWGGDAEQVLAREAD